MGDKSVTGKAIPMPTSELGAGNEYGWSDDLIRRSGLPKDVFELLHDIAYHHEGRDVNSYVIRAQKILSKTNAPVVREAGPARGRKA